MAFAAEEVEDGTGKTGAIVYEQAATVAAWLTRRGYPKFAALAESAQEAILIKATAAGEKAIRPRFVGYPIVEYQALLWPAAGAPDWRDFELRSDQVPDSHKEGVRLICEEMASGRYDSTASSVGVKRERHNGKELEYRDNGKGSGFPELFPDIYDVLKRSLPRTISG
jgi:hypothetical protein